MYIKLLNRNKCQFDVYEAYINWGVFHCTWYVNKRPGAGACFYETEADSSCT